MNGCWRVECGTDEMGAGRCSAAAGCQAIELMETSMILILRWASLWPTTIGGRKGVAGLAVAAEEETKAEAEAGAGAEEQINRQEIVCP